MEKNVNFTEGSIIRSLSIFALPVFLAMFLQSLYGAVDLLVVGQFGTASGAALATVLSQAFSVILCVIMVRKKGLPFSFSRENIRLDRKLTLQMLRLGLPIALQDGLVNVSFLAINAIVNTLGVIASAGVGVAEKVCAFIMLVPSSFSQSLSAFVAQNIGAGKAGRARQSMVCGMKISIAVGIIMAYLAFFHGDLLAGIFSSQEDVVYAAHDYLKSYAIDTLVVSFLFCYIGYFNGCGRTTFVMAQGITGAFLVRIPVSYLISKSAEPTLFKIGLATPASTVVQIIMCTMFFVLIFRREKKSA